MVGLTSIKHNNNDQHIEQTGQVDNLLHFLLDQEAAAVEALNLSAVVSLLKKANDRMHELIEGRVDEVLNKEVGAFASARQAAEEAYRQFVLSVNAWAVLNTDRLNEGSSEDGSTMSVAEFMHWANANIELYNTKLLKVPTDKVEEEVEDAEGGENQPTTPPAEGEQQPGEGEQQSGEGEQQPGEGEQQPGEGSQTPGTGGDNNGGSTGGGNNGDNGGFVPPVFS